MRYPMFGVAGQRARRKSLFPGASDPRRLKKCSDNLIPNHWEIGLV